ncbi:pseudouridine synthase [Paraglaciecola psychrophila]|jgi:tRNA pseudouridine32 synthase/23S rRNA pseudouridine746 synthase|uniref:Dual-specificity RNA pseudouridine synthase RluA n=1 Tax=Paraglaciecola psychrophila 170 TaxID=1129794 RepID=K6Z558_9ALTE|nr:pseudouridine synthase [Paraglaciecola psychrophila]AGH47033.1 pseudouridylate synthase [Paraglaciecola psychrophila 170]GAC40214.1 tRNA pseudouridine32 synthase [Paraglaciecola psychrophila 170]
MEILNYCPPMEPYLEIVSQDDDILVLNKPSGLLSVPGKEHADCLQARVQRVFPTATVVHRLDMSTSGLMVMALNKPAHRHISKQFELRETAKTYQAIVFDRVQQDSGEINLPLICDWPNRPKQMVDHEQGKKALTHWRVLERNTHSTRLELKPVTGRSHQLRVHMLSMQHPILGDSLYAHDQALAMSNRLNLHAMFLSFRHPVSEQTLCFDSEVPF